MQTDLEQNQRFFFDASAVAPRPRFNPLQKVWRDIFDQQIIFFQFGRHRVRYSSAARLAALANFLTTRSRLSREM